MRKNKAPVNLQRDRKLEKLQNLSELKADVLMGWEITQNGNCERTKRTRKHSQEEARKPKPGPQARVGQEQTREEAEDNDLFKIQ